MDEILQILSKNWPKKGYFCHFSQKHDFFKTFKRLSKIMKKFVTPANNFQNWFKKVKKLKQGQKMQNWMKFCKFCPKIGPKKAIFGHFSQKLDFFKPSSACKKLWKKLLHQPKIFKIDSKSKKIKTRAKNAKLVEILQILSKNRPKKRLFLVILAENMIFSNLKRL